MNGRDGKRNRRRRADTARELTCNSMPLQQNNYSLVFSRLGIEGNRKPSIVQLKLD